LLFNLPQPLLTYRTHEKQTSELRREEQRRKARLVQAYHLSAITTLAVAVRFYDVDRVRGMTSQRRKIAALRWIERQCEVLSSRNSMSKFFNEELLNSFLSDYKKQFIRSVMLTSYRYSPYLLGFYGQLLMNRRGYFSLVEMAKIFLKSLAFRNVQS
jgi:hypothetical protein